MQFPGGAGVSSVARKSCNFNYFRALEIEQFSLEEIMMTLFIEMGIKNHMACLTKPPPPFEGSG